MTLKNKLGSHGSNSPISRRDVVVGLASGAIAATYLLGGSPRARASAPADEAAQALHQDYFAGLRFSEEEETRVGKALFDDMLNRAGGKYRNREVQLALQEFAYPLFNTSPRSLYSWEIYIYDDFRPSAFALPGGKIGVSKGAVQYSADPDQLSLIIAHEIGHAELRHLEREMQDIDFLMGLSKEARERLLSELRNYGREGLDDRAVLGIMADSIYRQIAGGYSAELEREADERVAKVFRQTGHSLPNAVSFYDTLSALVPKGRTGANCLFTGHEEMQSRTASLREQAKEMRETLGARGQGGFDLLKQIFPTRQFFRRPRL